MLPAVMELLKTTKAMAAEVKRLQRELDTSASQAADLLSNRDFQARLLEKRTQVAIGQAVQAQQQVQLQHRQSMGSLARTNSMDSVATSVGTHSLAEHLSGEVLLVLDDGEPVDLSFLRPSSRGHSASGSAGPCSTTQLHVQQPQLRPASPARSRLAQVTSPTAAAPKPRSGPPTRRSTAGNLALSERSRPGSPDASPRLGASLLGATPQGKK